jgi:hypothetical protein
MNSEILGSRPAIGTNTCESPSSRSLSAKQGSSASFRPLVSISIVPYPSDEARTMI